MKRAYLDRNLICLIFVGIGKRGLLGKSLFTNVHFLDILEILEISREVLECEKQRRTRPFFRHSRDVRHCGDSAVK